MKNNKPRYLIFSSDERLWKFNQPVIFLGNWCCLHNRHNVWSKMDYIIAEPFGSISRRNADYSRVRQLEDELFPILCETLNLYHNTKYESRFWKIVLGVWFQRYVDVIYNRVETLKECLKNYKITGTTKFNSNRYDLITDDSLSALWSFDDERWNNELYSRIFDIIGPLDFPIENIHDNLRRNHFSRDKENVYSKNTNFFKKSLKTLNALACFFSRRDDSFIINSFLPKSKELGLHFSLGHIPKIWVNEEHKVSQKTDFIVRRKLTKIIDQYNDKDVKDVLRKLLFELIPVCYLEGFKEILNVAKSKKWPIKPRFIFTSNNYDIDEVFKTWTALKVMNGSRYIIGQHGNLSSIGSRTNRLIDQRIPDKFLSWGWSDDRLQVTPAFIFKTSGKTKKKYNKFGGILLTLCHYPHRENFWDASDNYIKTFENIKKFIRIIPIEYRQLLTVKLHGNWRDFNWQEKDRLKMFRNDIKIEDGLLPVSKLISKSKLVIHGYDSSGILETLSMNIPTLAFWHEGLGGLRDEARPYYEILQKSGIIHFDAETISKKVQNISKDVESWWNTDEVQLARKIFCDKYAKNLKAPINQLKNLLL